MGAEILLAAVFCGGGLIFAGRRIEEKSGEKASRFPLWAALLFLAGLTFRLFLGFTCEGYEPDMNTFKAWANTANQVGLQNIYRQDMFLDYPPGYLYILALLDKFRQLFGLTTDSAFYTLMMKLPSILADLLCAGVLLGVGKRKLGERNALCLSALYLFCPAVFINSAQWGQVDSFCTALLLASVLLLYRESYVLSAVLYGVCIISKPQMLIFAPLYLFFTAKQRRWGKLLLGVAAAVGTALLLALPFTRHFDFGWLFQKYYSTLHYYDYYSVNAYNFWALIGWNWKAMPSGGLKAFLTLLAPALATACCGVVLLFSKRKEALFLCPSVLMAAMYLCSVKMHERYLFPAFLFLLLSFPFYRDRRLITSFSLLSAANYLNVSYVLRLFRENGDYFADTAATRLQSAFQVAALLYLLYTAVSLCAFGRLRQAPPLSRRPLWELRPPQAAMSRTDVLVMAAVTLLYGCFAFWNLGGRQLAATPWAPQEGEQAVLKADKESDILFYLPGLAADENRYTSRVGVNFQVETSDDGKVWTDCGTATAGYVWSWTQYRLETPGKYVRLTALDGRVVLNEAALFGGTKPFPTAALGGGCAALTDEQEKVPQYTTYENSTYFDEIYHARTAYEHILGLEPYENTHPPLGKYIISLGIRMFGLNPFGWRFMGALFGVLMLPAFYHLLKQLLGKTLLCGTGTLLFAFDFMHFTQTRIATIDTYSVFFLILMYDAMTVFLRKDLKTEPMKKLLLPLFICGIFTGLGIASKWTAAYGALGLGVLFFGKLILSAIREKRETGQWRDLLPRYVTLCLWCCLFFLVIPFALYFLAYLPLCALPHNARDPWGTFWNYQINMFNYHSQLKAQHFFASPWYEWPLDIKPIWYFSQEPVDELGRCSTISAFGNPLLWWGGLCGLLGSAALYVKTHSRACAVALVGFLSAYLPWVLVPRLTFIYHYFTAIPFLVLSLMAVFSQLSKKSFLMRRVSLGGKTELSLSSGILGAFTLGCLALFAVYFPVISGAPAAREYINALKLFSTWYF